jgi:uncharacterized membrane protein
MSPRSLTIALLVSAALNIFLVGAAIGLFLFGPPRHPPFPLRDAAMGLDPANRAAFSQTVRDQFDASRPLLTDARGARREARRLMLTQPFDAEATRAALARARSDDQQVRQRIEDAVVDFAAKLSPEERVKLSDGIARGMGRRPRMGRP